MKHLAAYLLAQMGGNESPSAEDIKNILDSVGIAAEDSQLTRLLAEVKGKSVAELISAGKEKMGGVAVATGAATSGASGNDAAAEETVEEEPEPEEEEESDEDMGFGLFD